MRRVVLAFGACALVACGSSSSSEPPTIDATSETIADDVSVEAPATTKANGTLGDWSTLTPMPLARANHCAAFGSGYLFVVGGNRSVGGSFVATDLVHRAQVNADGTIGPWAEAGRMPSTVTECAAVARDGQLFVVDGIYADASKESQVFSSGIGADGKLIGFTSIGSLPVGHRALSQAAWIAGGLLHVTEDYLGDPDAGVGTTGVLRSDVAKVAFTYDGVDPHWRGRPEYAWTDAFVYFIGGYLAGATETTLEVDGARIGADGSLSGEFSTTKLPKPTLAGQGVGVDDWVFVVGGRDAAFGGTARADVISAPVHADGTLGDWTSQAPMPAPRTSFQLTLAGDWLFVTGGGDTGGGLDDVWSARVRF